MIFNAARPIRHQANHGSHHGAPRKIHYRNLNSVAETCIFAFADSMNLRVPSVFGEVLVDEEVEQRYTEGILAARSPILWIYGAFWSFGAVACEKKGR